jgi:hypothetical protein
LLTRAVNLASSGNSRLPISLHYPVRGPGFYCVAAVPYRSAHRYSHDNSSSSSKEVGPFHFRASLVASDPTSGLLPTFSAGLLRVYRVLGPAWMALALVLAHAHAGAARRRGLPQNGSLLPSRLWPPPLVLVAAVQVALRWTGLLAGGQRGMLACGLKVAWYVVFALLVVLVVQETHMLAVRWTGSSSAGGGDERRSTLRRVAYLAKWSVFVVLYCVAAWADWTADNAASRLQGCVNVFSGGLFAGLIWFWAITVVWRRTTFSATLVTSGFYLRFCCTLLLMCLGLLFTSVAAVNLWALIRHRTPLEYGHTLWAVRFWLVDGANELLVLGWVTILQILDLLSGVQLTYTRVDHSSVMEAEYELR